MQESYYEIYAIPEKNRMYMKLSGFFRDDKIQEAVDKFLSEVEKLKPGIDIINDISQFRPATAKGAEMIKSAQVKVAQKGVKRLVRVVDKSVSGLLQFKTTAKSAGYDGVNAGSLEEAEKYLDSFL